MRNRAVIRSRMRPETCKKGTIDTICNEYHEAFDSIDLVLTESDPTVPEYEEACKNLPITIHKAPAKNLSEKNNYIYSAFKEPESSVILMDDTIKGFIKMDKGQKKPEKFTPKEMKFWFEEARKTCLKLKLGCWGLTHVQGSAYLMPNDKGIHLATGFYRILGPFNCWVNIPPITQIKLESTNVFAEDAERNCQLLLMYGGDILLHNVRVMLYDKMGRDDHSGINSCVEMKEGEKILQARAREHDVATDEIAKQYPLLLRKVVKKGKKSMLGGFSHGDFKSTTFARSLYGIPAEELVRMNERLKKKP